MGSGPKEYCFAHNTWNIFGGTSLFFGHHSNTNTCLVSSREVERLNITLVDSLKSTHMIIFTQCFSCGAFASSFLKSREHYFNHSSAYIFPVYHFKSLKSQWLFGYDGALAATRVLLASKTKNSVYCLWTLLQPLQPLVTNGYVCFTKKEKFSILI